MVSKKNIIIILILVVVVIVGFWYFIPQSIDNNQTGDNDSPRERYQALGYTDEQIDQALNKIENLEQEIVKEEPNLYNQLLQVGLIYQLLHEYDQAKARFERAVEVSPEIGLAYANLAELYVFYYRDFDLAVENYKKAIERDWFNIDLYRSLADLYRSEFPEKKSEIEPMMVEAAQKVPDRARDFYQYLLNYFWFEGDIEKAIDYNQKALAIDPDDPQLQESLKTLQAERNK